MSLDLIRQYIWGIPLLALLFGAGIYLTYILRGFQFRYLGFAIKESLAETREESVGDISPFEALMTTLAGAIGTGSIVGVAIGLSVGGMGSLFWMWVMALLSMAIKYAESLLAVKYRHVDTRGEMIGGPMQYIEKGLGWKWLAIAFALLGTIAAVGTGNLVQANAIAESLGALFSVSSLTVGIITAIMTALVIIGGVKSIGRVAGIIVPVMALFYIVAGLGVLCVYIDRLPSAFWQIISSAFTGQAASGGFLGGTALMAIQTGVARSIFTNEAGMGVSAIAAAAAKTDVPPRQAMITMTGALFSTLIISTMTGLVIIVTGAMEAVCPNGCVISGALMTIRAFSSVIPGAAYIVTIGLILFAFSTIIAWAYYGEKCFEYLFGERYVFIYRCFFALIVIPGAVLTVDTVWVLADIANAMMVIPNLIAVLALSGAVVQETNLFLSKQKSVKK